MDLKTLLEEVPCSVCKSSFTDLTQLPCLHSFCQQCLNNLERPFLGVVTCPHCRDSESGNLGESPTNFCANSSLDVVDIKDRDTNGVSCGNCDKTSAQFFYCFQCCVFWCDACITGHNMIRENKEHRTLVLKHVQGEDMLNRTAFCPKKNHKEQELKLFCKKCEVAICNACAATDHKGHANKLQEETTNVKAVSKLLKQTALERRNEVSKLAQNSTEVHKQVADVKSRVQTTADHMTAVIEAQKQGIFNTVDSEAKEWLERLELKKSEVENQMKMAESAFEKFEALLNRYSNAEVQGFKETVAIIFQEQSAQSSRDIRDPGVVPCFRFTESKNLLKMLNNEGIGSVKTVAQHASEPITAPQEQHVRSNPFEAQAEARRFRSVLTFGQRGSSVGMLKCPWGLAVNDRNEIVVTEFGNHRVSVFSSDRNYLRSFGKFGELYYPTGIVYNNGKILVASRDNHRIQIYSSKGECLSEFVGLKDFHHQLKYPCGLSVAKDGNVIVADTGNKVIKIFSIGGDFLSKFGGECSFVDPYHCIQHKNYFVISDWGDHCIKIYDLNGKFLYTIGKEGVRDGEFNHPSLLSVNKEGQLMVCDSGNDRVQLFDLSSGKFVAKFGSEGSSTGEFNRPVSTAILDDGRIVVSDCENHRIQIFDSI